MRSRDVRPFTVEFKQKKRTTAAPPPSIWGKAADLFRTDPDPVGRPLERAGSSRSLPTHHYAPVKVRRVLPDLQAAAGETALEVTAIPATRHRQQKGGKTMSQEMKNHIELTITAPPVASDQGLEAALPGQGADDPDTAQAEPETVRTGDAPIVVPYEVEAEQDRAPVVVSSTVSRPSARRWTRKIEDLPRGERWKRRLPDVCR
jgi:hypothetical protein